MVLFLGLFAHPLIGQVNAEWYRQTVNINQIGMGVLGGWAMGNLITGGIGALKYSGEAKYFSQMNLMWNVVNLSIAGIGLYGNLAADPFQMTPDQMMSEHLKSQRIYLINAGLDVIYIGSGVLLNRLSSRSIKRGELMAGYGRSLVVQGAFLMAFDLIMWGILHLRQH
ncbi:MAG: hypothetical protein R6V75_08490 [Bacteroidales bacterium]